MSVDVLTAIRERRSVKKFTGRPVAREQLERLIEAATWAPNHRMTQPWRFLVLGPESRRAYGAVLAERKAKKVEDAAAADAVRRKVTEEHEALPAVIAVTIQVAEDEETREEDYAAVWMAIQNLTLAAPALGLGTHIKTGAVMKDARAREALRIDEGWRLVALVNIGEPAELPPVKERVPSAERTLWLP